MTSAVISTSGEQSARTYGHYQVVLSLPVDGGFAIAVHAATSPHQYTELSFTTSDVDTANLVHRVIKAGAEQGVSPEGIRAAVADALTAELHRVQARHDLPSRNRVEHINALLDRIESPADTARVAEIVDHMRRNLADTVPAGRQPQVTRSRSGVERKPLTKPQRRIVAGHINGVVYAGDGVRWTSLLSIARKGYAAEVHYVPGTKRVASIVLRGYGRTAATGGLAEQPATAVELASVTGPTEIAVHRDSGAYVATTGALNRYRADVDWLPVGAVWEDDDTHMVGTVDGEPVSVPKTMTLVVRKAAA
ncbi:hypothetical protein ACFYUR_19125 [Micromonospora haikouensis]|uniref:hypothetical protein n=1 Tax=Micromonospora haikouensis TaxID=686309 RepID=UPI0036A28BE3